MNRSNFLVRIQSGTATNEWTLDDIQAVAKKISDRVRGLSLKAVPSLTKRVNFFPHIFFLHRKKGALSRILIGVSFINLKT